MNDTDYKYVLQDFSKTMIGARFSYSELMDAERVPFKFRTIVDRLILPYADGDMTLEQHLLSLTPEDKNYRIYDSLKTKIKFFEPKAGGGFRERVVDLKRFTEARAAWSDAHMIQEIIISNLALSGFRL
ncbi:MAG: hypothetical protein IK115_08975 [Lachnospiraceae bacterium]|nr:hypothetical protein [Lachnospiraceae bacterium]